MPTLTWMGKEAVLNHHREIPFHLLKENPELSVGDPPHLDLTKPDAQLFIHRAVTGLIERSGVTIDQLAREKHRLRKALEEKIETVRASQRGKSFQAALFDRGADICVDQSLTLGMGDARSTHQTGCTKDHTSFETICTRSLGNCPAMAKSSTVPCSWMNIPT